MRHGASRAYSKVPSMPTIALAGGVTSPDARRPRIAMAGASRRAEIPRPVRMLMTLLHEAMTFTPFKRPGGGLLQGRLPGGVVPFPADHAPDPRNPSRTV